MTRTDPRQPSGCRLGCSRLEGGQLGPEFGTHGGCAHALGRVFRGLPTSPPRLSAPVLSRSESICCVCRGRAACLARLCDPSSFVGCGPTRGPPRFPAHTPAFLLSWPHSLLRGMGEESKGKAENSVWPLTAYTTVGNTSSLGSSLSSFIHQRLRVSAQPEFAGWS